MKIKKITKFSFVYCFYALGILIFLTLSCNVQIQAQDFPYALERETELSPRSIDDFKQLVYQYKQAICFPSGLTSSNNRQQQQQQQNIQCSVDETKAIRMRNALIYATLSQIDLNFTKYQKNSRRRKAIFETLMDFLIIAGDTAAIITNGARPKNIINASSALVQLTRESVDKNLRLAESQAIFNQMQANRLRVMGIILPKITGANKLGIVDYPFEAAWLDIVAYYRAGTWDEALSNIAANTAKQKEEEEIKIQGFKPSPLVSREEKEFADSSILMISRLDKQIVSNEANIKKAAEEKLQSIVRKMEGDVNIKKILEEKKLTSSDKADDIVLKLMDIRSNLRTFQNFEVLNKINRIITEVGLEK